MIVIDAVPTAADIDHALARLEAAGARARHRGRLRLGAAGSIDRIAQWAKAAQGRGIVLVPISAVAIEAEVELTQTSRAASHGRILPIDSRAARHKSAGMAKTRYEDLPYRPCVGMMVINRDGRVFIGRRLGGPEHIDDDHVWQMPQGGIDEGEDPYPRGAARTDEETNIRSVKKLGEIADWLTYDIPRQIAGKAWKGKYRGQKQKWFALRFTGNEKRDRHRCSPAAATSRNSSNGAGSRCEIFPR